MAKSATTINTPKPPLIQEQYIPWLLGALAFILYVSTIGYGFALDDVAVIGSNKFVHEGVAGIPKILTTFYWQGFWNLNAGLYRPLSLVMFAVEWQISPSSPMLHHIVQVLLYAVTIAVLYKLLRRLFAAQAAWLPLATTLLFAAHPIHTEVVANIKSRDEILCFLFFVLTASEFVAKRRITWVAMLCYTLCLLSKEAGLLYLPVLLLIGIQFMGRQVKDALMALLPLLVIAAVWLCWHTYVISVLSPSRVAYSYADNSLLACPGAVSRIATGFVVLGTYMFKSVWPYTMSYDYSFADVPCEGGFSVKAISVLLLCVALLFAAYRYFRKYPVIAFGILFFFCTMALASNVFYIIGTTMGDRLLFAPVLGTALIIVWGIYKLTGQLAAARIANPAGYIVLALLAIFSYRSVARSSVWENDTTLFTADTDNAPGSARVQYNYGTVLLNSLPTDKAGKDNALATIIPLFEKAIAIDSLYADAYANLGVACAKARAYAKAIEATKHAMRLKPMDTSLHANLGDAYLQMQQYDSAIVAYEYCLTHHVRETNIYNSLGSAYFNLQQYDRAINTYKAGVAQDSSNADMWNNYANVLGMSKDYTGAIAAFGQALRIEPARKSALYGMALTYQNMGDTAKAKEYFARYQSK